MSVTVDQRPLSVESLGLRNLGQVLSHLRRDNRLVVQVLIDGKEPDRAHLRQFKRQPLGGHTIYIETADAREMARGVLRDVEVQLREADRLRTASLELLDRSQAAAAIEKLSGCFSYWQHAQETVLKTAELLRIDLSCLRVEGRMLTELLGEFSGHVREIRRMLEERDFAGLSRLLGERTEILCAQWYQAIHCLRQAIG